LLLSAISPDKQVDVTIHHGLHCSFLRQFGDPSPFDTVENGGRFLRDIAFFSILSVDFGALSLDFVKLGFQHFIASSRLRPWHALPGKRLLFRSAYAYPHRSFHHVNVLPAFSAAAKRADLQIGGILLWSGVSNFRNNIDTRERSVTPLVCVEGEIRTRRCTPRSA
jgi:hypothetical protein